MIITTTHHNALYTIEHEDSIYIRQFTRSSDDATIDVIYWFNTNDGIASQIQDEHIIKDLEDAFTNTLE